MNGLPKEKRFVAKKFIHKPIFIYVTFLSSYNSNDKNMKNIIPYVMIKIMLSKTSNIITYQFPKIRIKHLLELAIVY